MKQPFILILMLSLLCHLGLAQDVVFSTNVIDSMQAKLVKTNQPLQRFDLLNRIMLEKVGWKGTNIDSTSSIELVKIAQELKNDSLLAVAYNWIGTYFNMNKADYPTALDYYFKALPLAKKANDKRRISSLYFDIGLIYFDLEDYNAALENTRKGGQYLPDESHPLFDFMLQQYLGNMTQYHTLVLQADSAIYYAEKLEHGALSSKTLNVDFYIANSAVYLGAAYAIAGQEDLAFEKFAIAEHLLKDLTQSWFTAYFYNSYIPLLIANDRQNDAKRLALNMLKLGNELGNQYLILYGSKYLRLLFDIANNLDSAYYYSRKEAETTDLMFGQQNKNKLQSMAFNEQLQSIVNENKEIAYRNQLRQYGLLAGLGMVLIIAFILLRNNKQKQRANNLLTQTLSNLKSTQEQLIHSEKMASLGELTAGIAHEIQNPLNFVNNFSDLSEELMDELEYEIKAGNSEEVKAITKDLKDNLSKIHNHGERASSIVKGMLQHSRTGTGEKELIDLNPMADEYLRLAFHGLRAKDKSFNSEFELNLDENLPKINAVPQDIGRVLLNLINNAFHAVRESEDPKVEVRTASKDDTIEIHITDNGPGIPEEIKEKIFQPFFTTKATGEGTGLGLSMSYDIITKGHDGKITVQSENGTGTTFIIELPAHQATNLNT